MCQHVLILYSKNNEDSEVVVIPILFYEFLSKKQICFILFSSNFCMCTVFRAIMFLCNDTYLITY